MDLGIRRCAKSPHPVTSKMPMAVDGVSESPGDRFIDMIYDVNVMCIYIYRYI